VGRRGGHRAVAFGSVRDPAKAVGLTFPRPIDGEALTVPFRVRPPVRDRAAPRYGDAEAARPPGRRAGGARIADADALDVSALLVDLREEPDRAPGDPVPHRVRASRGTPNLRTPPADAAAGAGRRHIPALDGLRAFAVLAVLCYHAGVSWLPGGLLGVDLFFVLSGFLITGLLLDEHRRTGHIALTTFWARRARRLLPALLLVLLAVAAYARFIADPSQATSLRSDAIATLCYVANWRFALSHQGYFAHLAAPSPLLHTWSLAVEEQYYLLWPLIVLGLLSWGTRRRKRRDHQVSPARIRTFALAGAAISATDALVLSLRHTDPSRIYYGTDTRSQALFVGAALAAAMALRSRPFEGRTRAALTVAGLTGALTVLTVFATVDGQSSGLDRGGFLLVALAAAAVVASVAAVPDSPLARFLSLPPLRYVGRISYGVYLWHWPLFLVLTAARTHVGGGAPLLLLRFAVTFAVATASFHLFEQPVRTGRFRLPAPRLIAPTAIALVAAVVVATTASVGAANAGDGGGGVNASTLDRIASQTAAHPARLAPRTAAPNRPVRVLVVGDSVAWTFAWNIGTAKINLKPYGVQLANRAIIGCGIMGDIPQHVRGKIDYGNAVCPTWRSIWAQGVTDTQPDVVAILIGRWETTDRLINGQWTHVGEPDFDAFLAGQLDAGIATASAHGAKVALLTAPVYQQLEGPSGAVYTETLASRVYAFNRDLAAAAARHPGVAQIVDFGHVLTPDGQYHLKIGGKEVRWADDGVHVTPAGTELELPVIMPQLAKIGRSAMSQEADARARDASPAGQPPAGDVAEDPRAQALAPTPAPTTR
jgi:peptidoglycan/LPS O-acetylase OafA/YrhL